MQETRKFTAFLHMLHNQFYFSQNDVYFILWSFSIQITFTFLINHTLISKYQVGKIKVKRFQI
jgi:hypothetical protein